MKPQEPREHGRSHALARPSSQKISFGSTSPRDQTPDRSSEYFSSSASLHRSQTPDQAIDVVDVNATEYEGYFKMLAIMLPTILFSFYEGDQLWKDLPLANRIGTYLGIGLAIVAMFSIVASLTLNSSRVNRLPFRLNPQRVMRVTHDVGVYFTAYVFTLTTSIWMMREEPLKMWVTVGILGVAFTAMLNITWKRDH